MKPYKDKKGQLIVERIQAYKSKFVEVYVKPNGKHYRISDSNYKSENKQEAIEMAKQEAQKRLKNYFRSLGIDLEDYI